MVFVMLAGAYQYNAQYNTFNKREVESEGPKLQGLQVTVDLRTCFVWLAWYILNSFIEI